MHRLNPRLSGLMLGLSILGATAPAAAQDISNAVIGDVDNDNQLTNADLRSFQQQRLGRAPLNMAVTDLNGDGMVDASDQQLCTRAVLGIPTPMRVDRSMAFETGQIVIIGAHLGGASVTINGAPPGGAVTPRDGTDGGNQTVNTGLVIDVNAATQDGDVVVTVGGETFTFPGFVVQRTATLRLAMSPVTEPPLGMTLEVMAIVELDRPATEDLSFEVALMGGTATLGTDPAAGADLLEGPLAVVISSGQSSGSAPITVFGDAINGEGTETVSVLLQNPMPTEAVRVDPNAQAEVLMILDAPLGVDQNLLVSVNRAGTNGGNANSALRSNMAISADGRFVAFESLATDLVTGDTNSQRDIFVRDTVMGTTILVSRADGLTGVLGNGESANPSISADGRYVSFDSAATNLVNGDTNSVTDVFVRDLMTHTTELVSRASTETGALGNGPSQRGQISGNGRFVVFDTEATNLFGGDNNSRIDVFVRNLDNDATVLVSRADGATGLIGDGESARATISADGSVVAFDSISTNLTADSTFGGFDIYVRDIPSGSTQLVSRATGANGAVAQGNVASFRPSISANGRIVAFESSAFNFVADDNNGTRDVFVRDLDNDTTVLASRATGVAGAVGTLGSNRGALSADGRFVFFDSEAPNLAAGDTNNNFDIFVRDLTTNETRLVSRAPGGPADFGSVLPASSADGSFVAFFSLATNLVANDSNNLDDVFVRRLR